MTKKWIVFSLFAFAFAFGSPVLAQTDSTVRRIAIFTPLYLDSAFDETGNYRYDNKTFPKIANQGLEFYEGVQMAIDSLNQEGLTLDIHVYDSRGANRKFDSVLNSEELKTMNLIIGHVNVNEAALLAHKAALLQIPFINANYPVSANVTNNPYYVVMNTTLQTHYVGIYRYLQRNHSLAEIIVFKKKGDEQLRNFFTEFEKNTSVKLKVKYVNLDANFTSEQLKAYLKTDKTNVCLAGSLDQVFAQNLCAHLASLSATHPCTVVGMPTWDVIEFERSQYKGLEIVYSTPFYIAPAGKLAATVYDDFKTNYYSRPTDMVFRGFETLYHFAHLLNEHGDNLKGNLNDKRFMLFNEVDIQPVVNKNTAAVDYYENKKLYFVKKMDGIVKQVN
jgi:hypothetical protein